MNVSVITSAIMGAVVGSMGTFVVVTHMTVTMPEPPQAISARDLTAAIVEADRQIEGEKRAEGMAIHCRRNPDEC